MNFEAKRFTPQPESQKTDTWDLLPVNRINNKHELMHKPGDWEIVDGEWLPILSPLYFSPSSNGYVASEGPEHIRAYHRNKGCSIIPPGSALLEEYADYMGTIPCYNPEMSNSLGKYWCSIFETPDVVGTDVMWNLDVEEWNKFRKLLVKNGIVRLNQTIARSVIQRKQKALSALENSVAGLPKTESRTAMLEKARTALQHMKDSLKTLDAPVQASQKNRKNAKFQVEKEG